MKKYKSLRYLNGRVSFLLNYQSMFIFITLLVLTSAVFIISIGLGELKISPFRVLQVIFGGGSDRDRLVIQTFRMPRSIIALLVGMGLAVAGGILQGIIRNPLASPDIIGITGGAAVAVVCFLAIFSDASHSLTVSIKWMPVAAFIGATLTAYLVYFLSWKKGVSPIRLVLIGIGIATLMKSLTTLMITLGPIYHATQVNIWITGSVSTATWDNVTILAPWIVLFILLAIVYARNINIQELGDDIATGLGGSIQRQRFTLLTISTALIGGSVAFSGGISFVGLMAPHMARRLVGSSYGALLPVSALLGGILVMLADLFGRTFFSPLEIPAGVFTASIGAPYFIYLLVKSRKK